jgi:hypothetical protein
MYYRHYVQVVYPVPYPIEMEDTLNSPRHMIANKSTALALCGTRLQPTSLLTTKAAEVTCTLCQAKIAAKVSSSSH